MDGTLLGSRLGISKGNQAAIRAAQAAGIEFMVATGRNYQEARSALDEAGIECALITLNGAQVFDQLGNSLFTVPINKELALASFAILDAHDIYYEVFTDKGLYSENQSRRIDSMSSFLAEHLPHLTRKQAIAMTSAQMLLMRVNFTTSIKNMVAEDAFEVLKIICFNQDGRTKLGPIAKKIDDLGYLAVTSSGQNNIEINHKNAQKGIAVAHVAQNRKIPLEQVMTIGDNFNDVSMLEVAGVSFAMGNAEVDVKEYAKYVTDTNLEDGVGKAILRAIEEEL